MTKWKVGENNTSTENIIKWMVQYM